MTSTELLGFLQPRRLATAVLATLLAVSAAEAGSISISITADVQWAEGIVTAKVKIANGGDEAALNVSPELRFREQALRGNGKPSLAPGETHDETMTLPVAALGAGKWPYRLAVDYTDANQHPFQALSVNLLAVGKPEPTRLSIRPDTAGEPIELEDRNGSTATFDLIVNNSGPAARDVTVAVVVPAGIDVAAAPAPLKIAAGEETETRAKLVSRDVLAGSSYPIFMVAEFDADGVHHAIHSQGLLKIVPKRSLLLDNQNLLWIAAGVVVAVWAAALVWRLAGRRAMAPQS